MARKSAPTIIAAQQAEGCGLVVKQHVPDNPLKRALLTPEDWKLLRYCPCPVLMVKTDNPWTGGNILAAVDVGNADLEHRTPTPPSSTTATRSPTWLTASCICDQRASAMLSAADPAFQLKETIEARYREACKRFQEEFDIPDAQLHVEEGPADALIPRVCHQQAVVTVIGTVARTGFSGALMGGRRSGAGYAGKRRAGTGRRHRPPRRSGPPLSRRNESPAAGFRSHAQIYAFTQEARRDVTLVVGFGQKEFPVDRVAQPGSGHSRNSGSRTTPGLELNDPSAASYQ